MSSSDPSDLNQFPDITEKLKAPTKKSVFERQKAEAEAKKLRERAETAAVYESFVKSFEDDGASPFPSLNRNRGGGGGETGRNHGLGGLGMLGPGRRHFSNTQRTGRNSGPGTLGPPPPHFRKREHSGYQSYSRDNPRGVLGFESSTSNAAEQGKGFNRLDDEDDMIFESQEGERAAAKPTLYVTSMPPDTTPGIIKAMLQPMLTVDSVKMLPPTPQGNMERKNASAIVTLARETPASVIDSTVSNLQGRYLSCGYYLSVSRHLSSAAINSGAPMFGSVVGGSASLPFGAKPVDPATASGLNRAPPPGTYRGSFAPPPSHGSGGNYNRNPQNYEVVVVNPADIKQLKLIHTTVAKVLQHGVEMEALLMNQPTVQKDEHWAFLYDARSKAGVYYRWKLWEALSGARDRPKTRHKSYEIFEGQPKWIAPPPLKFENVTNFEELANHPDYDSSDEDEPEEESHRTEGNGEDEEPNYLNPLRKAKLVHLLARLPPTIGQLRKGDVARVTAFAIQHASSGADEVVELIIRNIKQPFIYSMANPNREQHKEEVLPEKRDATEGANETEAAGPFDTSSSKLIGLYLVSDILSSSSTSGVRHAWRYRQLFEAALKNHKVFEHIGRLDKDLQWGRLKAEKWKRSVGAVLSLWEGWCVFPQEVQEHFAKVFAEPPLTKKEQEELATMTEQEKSIAIAKSKSRWRTVDDSEKRETDSESADDAMEVDETQPENELDPDNYDSEDLDGEPMEEEKEEKEEKEAAVVENAVRFPSVDSSEESYEPQLTESEILHAEGEKEHERERLQKQMAKEIAKETEDMFAASDSE